MGFRILLLNGYGHGDLLRLLSHVEGARLLRKRWSSPYQIPGISCRRFRVWMDVLFCYIHSNCHQYWSWHRSNIACWGMPSVTKIMYSSLSPDGPLKLYEFIAMVTAVMIVLSQLPTFHSLRHINLASLFFSLGYTFIVVGACIDAGLSKNAPSRDYSLESSGSARVFSAFTSISIIAAIFGNGILPEIQATLAPPATGKMVKGLLMCYTVILLTFYSASVSGYWAFGNKSNSNIIKSLMPDEGPSLAPTWVLGLGVIFVLLQLLAIGLVYSQVAYEIMEKKSADVKQGMFSKRNLIPRLILRTLYMMFCGFMAAMLPFFGDINGVVGAIGFIPLDFVLPMLLYNMTYKPPKSSFIYWVNLSIMVVFTGAGLMGAFSSVRKLILDANKFKLFSSNVVD
ncbi:probable GABA transporter 2 isoform X2 [Populus alba]|uniref:probable GABA transporter 2 isoform X2 n=1 Tax=Populus alba TaxID=43335 RepID=UPI0015888FC4|nr:probable GABA transporter 2 isoform X2 [Populus alba]